MYIEILVGVISGVSSSLMSIIMVIGAIKRPLQERVREQQEDLKHLKDDKIQAIEKEIKGLAGDLKAHLSADKSQQILTSLESLSGLITKMTDKLDRVAETSAKQQAEINGNRQFLENLNASLNRHKKEN